jgi:hypothetical protein
MNIEQHENLRAYPHGLLTTAQRAIPFANGPEHTSITWSLCWRARNLCSINSAMSRVTIGRELPIICARSSWREFDSQNYAARFASAKAARKIAQRGFKPLAQRRAEKSAQDEETSDHAVLTLSSKETRLSAFNVLSGAISAPASRWTPRASPTW